jgi:hypothetical protein
VLQRGEAVALDELVDVGHRDRSGAHA